MNLAYARCLIALRRQTLESWELSRFHRAGLNLSANQLKELNSEWRSFTRGPERHEHRLRLRAEHPEAFAEAARGSNSYYESTTFRLLAALYLPELWSEVADEVLLADEARRLRDGWEQEFANADDEFLGALPASLYNLVQSYLADSWWWLARWNETRRLRAAASGDRTVGLQLAMMAGDATKVANLMGAEQKREGYAIVWDFLNGKPDVAYLALTKLVNRRRQGAPIFPTWAAMWARLIALSQGDQALFEDRRLEGNDDMAPALANIFLDLSLQNSPSGETQGLGAGLLACGLWVARQHYKRPVRLDPEVQTYWRAQGMNLLADQLQENPTRPLFQEARSEQEWETFLRLLQTQAEVLQKPAASSSTRASSKSTTGALLWHLDPPSLIFYNDKTASPDQGPESLGGKAVKSKALLSRMPSYLNDKDRIALAKVRLNSYGDATITADLLRALVGNPRVYIKERRFDLSEQGPYLRIDREFGGLKLKLRPLIPGDQDYLLEEETGRFWTRSPLEKVLQPLLQGHAPVPLSAERELRQVVSKWADRIEIRVGQGLAAMQQAQFRVDELVLRARSQGKGMRFDWLARCSQQPEFLRPAFEGPEQERVAQNDSVTVFVRDFRREQQQWERYLSACPGLPQEPTFRLDGLPDVLELLQQCQEAGVPLEWPEGAAWTVRRADALKVQVRKSGDEDWFSLEGELSLGGGGSLELQSALVAARLSQGSYLKLGETDFLRLDAELREQLVALADLADAEEPRVSALAVPSLAELELAGLSSDDAFQERLATFQESAAFEATVPRRLEAELRDYQVEGFRWLARHARMGTGACLADDMGLGKTLQSIALMLHLRSEGPHLVVCPLSVVAQGEQQIELFAPTLRAGRDRELKGLKAGDVVLCSYGVLLRDIKKLSKVRWSVAVLDEAQAIKNPQSKTARCAYQLQAKFRLATTGTPIENRLSELWSLFAFLNPGLLGTLAAFRRRYEQPGAGRSRLRRLIAPFVLRRMKSQVLSELPPRTEVTLKVPLAEAELELYESIRLGAQRDLEEGKNFELLAHLTRLRQACCHPRLVLPESEVESSKLEVLFELLERLGEGHHRALVFSQFTRFLDLVQEQLEARGVGYQRLDGSTSARERERRVAAFQEGEGEVFLISLKAGGTGLNLTGADYVIHLDPWWNPAAEDQASDRAHRIGQKRPVTVYRLVAENTLEEKVVRLHGHKRDLAQSVLEGNDQASPLSVEELRELLRMA